jgi:hypothetical protein
VTYVYDDVTYVYAAGGLCGFASGCGSRQSWSYGMMM